MSAATTTQASRTRRGRAVVVGDVRGLPPMLATSTRVVCVRNLFEAIGEITVAAAGSPITTVIIAPRDLPSDPRQAVQAVRKVDPAVTLVLLTESDDAGEEWLAAGFDECIGLPLETGDWPRLLDGEHLSGSQPLSASDLVRTESPAKGEEPADSPGRKNMEMRRPEVQEHRPAVAEQREALSAPNQHSAPSTQHAARNTENSTQQPAPVEPLGDTDLVHAVMNGPETLPMALRLIAQQTGWNDVALTAEPSHPEVGSAPVVYEKCRFGLLTSEKASAAQLTPWAGWLATWLALDAAFHEHRCQALEDELTGAANRRFFNQFLRDAIARASKARRPVTLMVFDIDDFKRFNDQFGHDAGDEILRETVRLLKSVIRQGDQVCRIGGDEFAVIFADPEGPREPGSTHPDSVETIARRFQDQVCKLKFPKLGPEAPGTLSISAGLATYPWDGHDPAALLRHADQLALESKRKGKNAMTFGPGAQEACRR